MCIDYPKLPFKVSTSACLSLVLCMDQFVTLRFLPLLSTPKSNSMCKTEGRSTPGGACWPDLQEGSVCNQLHRRQRDLQALSVLNGISWDILLKMSLSAKIRENVLLRRIWLMMVSQQSVGLKVKGSMCLPVPCFGQGV